MNPGNVVVKRPEDVRDYLVAAYMVDAQTAAALVSKHPATEDAIQALSFAYWPGDKIARAEGLSPRDGFDPDAE